MNASKYSMRTVAYFLLHIFKSAIASGISVKERLESIGYEEYHNFWKCRLPVEWYEDLLVALDLTSDDLLVEVARVKGNHAKDLHYHDISHAICVVLGPQCGFSKVPTDAAVQNGTDIKIAFEDMECYFPQGRNHTFYGSTYDKSDEGDLYFISIQSPPLLTSNNDDFYWVFNNQQQKV